MAKMRAAQVRAGKGPFEIVERDVPEPGPGSVRVKVQASGICHSDSLTKEGLWPGIQYPRVPGHEVAGIVDAIGAGVADLKVGGARRPGLARRALRTLRLLPPRRLRHLPGRPDPGHHLRRRSRGLRGRTGGRAGADPRRPVGDRRRAAHVRRDHDLQLAAPRGRASGDLVAVLGIGGLGHLGVQFAARMGYETVAIARGKDKEPLARKLGAHHYIDSEAQDPAKELSALGGAKVVLATVTSGKAMTAALGGLAIDGTFVVLGAAHEPIEVSPLLLISGAAGSWAGPRAPRPTRRTRWRSARATACGR